MLGLRPSQSGHSSTQGRSQSSSCLLRWISRDFIENDPTLFSDRWHVLQSALGGRDGEVIAKGGSGTVVKIVIHPSHIRIPESGIGESRIFAVKRLRSDHRHIFDQELRAYTQLAPSAHPHITRLLMAYESGNHNHLVLPFAKGTLETFFQSFSPSASWRQTNLPWLLGQFTGLADGLRLIHEH